jgi:FtsP/CotA-like multicopper oxidase with cupredoxin domain
MPNPDGSGGKRPVMLINNQYPGPVIRAKWGDWIVVNVKNNLQHVSAYLVPYCLCL